MWVLIIILLSCCVSPHGAVSAQEQTASANGRLVQANESTTTLSLPSSSLSLPPGGGRVHHGPAFALQKARNVIVVNILKPLLKQPWIILEGLFVTVVMGESLAMAGVIGNKGEGLYDWWQDQHHHPRGPTTKSNIGMTTWLLQKVGFQPGGLLRRQLESTLRRFDQLPYMPKFATGVSVGGTVLPFLVQTILWACRCLLVGLVIGEILAMVGVLGDPGHGLHEWYANASPGSNSKLFQSARRTIERARWTLRKDLQLTELLSASLQQLRKDSVFWSGFFVGCVACAVFEVMDRNDNGKLLT